MGITLSGGNLYGYILAVVDTSGRAAAAAYDTVWFGALDSPELLGTVTIDNVRVIHTPAGGGLIPTVVTLASPTNPASNGVSLSFTAAVSPDPGSGSVLFRTNGVAVGAPVALAGGVAASPAVAGLPAGSTDITAEFTGNATHTPSAGSLIQLVLGAGVAGPPPGRPNFIFIITDDQRWDAVGVTQQDLAAEGRARFPWFTNQTPRMDRLAREGVRFRNAFVTQAVCSPSRAAFLTGQYNHRNGVVNNGTDFPPAAATYASVLRTNGYVTAYAGKWHMNVQVARPGFDYAASFLGQGNADYFDQRFLVKSPGAPLATNDTTGWVDYRTRDFALRYLTNVQHLPFALVVAFKTPHDN